MVPARIVVERFFFERLPIIAEIETSGAKGGVNRSGVVTQEEVFRTDAFHSGAFQYTHRPFANTATTRHHDAQVLRQRIGVQVALQFFQVVALVRRLQFRSTMHQLPCTYPIVRTHYASPVPEGQYTLAIPDLDVIMVRHGRTPLDRKENLAAWMRSVVGDLRAA